MRLENFCVEIPEGDENEDNYVSLRHGQTYTIKLSNYNITSCDADVNVDGKSVGIFRLYPGSTIKLQRSVNDKGKFTFYKDGTSEFKSAELHKVNRSNRGLISVTFKPGKEKNEVKPLSPTPYVPPVPHPVPSFPPYNPWIDPHDPYSPYKRKEIDYCCDNSQDSKGGQHTNSVRRSGGGISGQCVSSSTLNAVSGGTGLSGKSNQTFYEVSDLEYDTSRFVTINLRLVCNEVDEPRPLKSVRVRSNEVPKPV